MGSTEEEAEIFSALIAVLAYADLPKMSMNFFERES